MRAPNQIGSCRHYAAKAGEGLPCGKSATRAKIDLFLADCAPESGLRRRAREQYNCIFFTNPLFMRNSCVYPPHKAEEPIAPPYPLYALQQKGGSASAISLDVAFFTQLFGRN